jgi:hypothetical protein
MKGFKLITQDKQAIRFTYYLDVAPITSRKFSELLPFSRRFMHARVSGQEVWTDNAPDLDTLQENASVFTFPGEVVFGPSKPIRNKTNHCMGIYYGEGRGLDAANIFAKVVQEDVELLKKLGEQIWISGQQELLFEAWE